jgi:CheY-like chemotaxis protein
MNALANHTCTIAISECRVLVAEDDPLNVMLVEAVLQYFGCHFEIVGTGSEALSRVAQGDVDIVLLDFHMPGLNGAQTASAIRQWEQETAHRRTHVIGLTASAMPAEVAHCIDAGMDQVMTKPFDIGDLRRTLMKACESLHRATL